MAARKTILSIRKTFADAKEKNENYSLDSRCKRCTLDAARRNRDDRRAMKIFRAFVFLGLAPAVFAAEPAQTVFINGNIETVNERQEHAEAIAVRAAVPSDRSSAPSGSRPTQHGQGE